MSNNNKEVICSYCKKPAKLVTGKDLFPNYRGGDNKYYWHCKTCAAWIGCYDKSDFYNQDGKTPMGTLARVELRSIRTELHKLFDILWKSDHMMRGEAYMWLAKKMKLTVDECHIGMFDYPQCCEAYTYVYKYIKHHNFG